MQLSAAALATGFGMCLYTWRIGPHHVEFVRRAMPVEDLPASLEGRTLAQVSDIHVGPQVSDDYLFRVFDRLREAAPDVIAYTGDFVSLEPDIGRHARRVYERIPLGKLTTVGVLGNHDYGHAWADTAFASWMAQLLAGVGVTVLRNEIADVAGLQVVGMDDLWARQFDPARAFASLDRGRAAIALSHNPDTADMDGWSGYEGWILSGHTHGGQCKPPFLPPPLLPVLNRRYTAGEFDVGNNLRLYVNRGVGHLLPVRFNVRPEVTLFTLHRA